MTVGKIEILSSSWFNGQELVLRDRYLLPYFVKAINGYVFLYKKKGKTYVKNLHHMTDTKFLLIKELCKQKQ